MLRVNSLSVAYGQHRALNNASLTVDRGEIVVILGANGAGKSTLLKSIAGICEGESAGSVSLGGEELVGAPPHRIVDYGLALVPEGRGVFGDLTVQENLVLGAYSERARLGEEQALERIFGLFPKLMERRRQPVRTMSGGEQQMVAIGRAMMSNPEILALDEPSLGLSPLLSKELFQSLTTVRDAGVGVLLVEQNAKQSLKIADRGYLLENGGIIHEDAASALLNDPSVQRAYLGGAATGKQDGRTTSKPAAGAKPIPTGAPNAPSAPAPLQPSGPSPKDIAAAAIAKVGSGAEDQRSSGPPRASVSAQQPQIVSRPSIAPPTVPSERAGSHGEGRPTVKPPPAPAASSATLPAPDFPDVAKLVSSAHAASRSQYSSTSGKQLNANGDAAPPKSAAPTPGDRAYSRPKTPNVVLTPDPEAASNRLRSILEEIETSARDTERRSSSGLRRP